MGLLVVAAAIILIFLDLPAQLYHWDLEQVLSLANDNILLLIVTTFLLMIVQNLLSFFPLVLLVTINLSLFGLVNGYLWSLISSISGAAAAFFVVRFGVQSYFLKKLHKHQSLIKRIENNGFYYVLLMRVFPLLPTSIINMAVGLSTVTFKSFLYGTILGNMIYIFILTLIPMGLMSEGSERYIIAILFVFLLIGFIFWRKFNKKKHQHGES